MEGQDVALQVEGGGVGTLTPISRTQEHDPSFRVNALVLFQEPPIPECLLTLVTLHPHCTHTHTLIKNSHWIKPTFLFCLLFTLFDLYALSCAWWVQSTSLQQMSNPQLDTCNLLTFTTTNRSRKTQNPNKIKLHLITFNMSYNFPKKNVFRNQSNL